MLAATSSLSLWIILLLGAGVCARRQHARAGEDDDDGGGGGVVGEDEDDDGGSWPESVARARCASRCLGLHSVAARSTSLQNNGSLGWCQNHKQCAKCLEPCKESWEMKRKSNCRELCERAFPKKHGECATSCEFLQSARATKQGRCPAPERASGFAAACVESCDRDRECPAQRKCCSNGCGHTCQSPKDLHKGCPMKPRKELGLQELPSGQLEVRWSSRFNVSAEPVVHVLQRRWNFGIQPSEDAATPWQGVAQTTEQGVRLSDIRPGRWYQFRVAAVNTHGTRGFTTPSKHVHSRRDPSRPPAPTELRVANMSFEPGRAVAATLRWSLPADPDVPVHHCKVSWSWTAAGQASASSLAKRRKTVRGKSQVELDSLRSNRSYRVEVQAVSYWGQTQLRGARAVLHFTTQRGSGSTPGKPAGDLLDVGTPFYQDGQLRVHVYWQSGTDPSVELYKIQWGPEYCGQNRTGAVEKTSTKENFIALQGLLFGCRYNVVLRPLGRKGRPPAVNASFFTPSCAAVQAKSPVPIPCPGETMSPQKVRVKVANLTASFEVRGDNVTGVFRWDLSEVPPRRQLTGCQVTWAELVPTGRRSNSDKRPPSLTYRSQILPPDGRVLVVSGLHPASLYRLQVHAVTAEGEGPATSRNFQTPGYQSTTEHRSRLRRHQS